MEAKTKVSVRQVKLIIIIKGNKNQENLTTYANIHLLLSSSIFSLFNLLYQTQ
jgi:hypothetical protein